MRIVIDLQGAQTESRFRGIGRYSQSLALAIVRNAGEHEVWLVLNAAFPESILDIRHAFKGLIPQERIRVFEVPLPVAEHDSANASRSKVAELIREHFIQQLNPDVILLTSLFEDSISCDAVTSVGKFSSGQNTAVILYDLIPYLDPEKYLPTKIHQEYYERKIQSLKRAGLLLAISDASRQEGIQALNFEIEKIVAISTAVDDSFRPIDLTEERIIQLISSYGIRRKIVMYAPGGFDVRKNFKGLIKAYSLLSKKLRSEYQLVIANKINDGDRKNLVDIAKEVGLVENEMILTGYVPDEDLIALYNLATLFVFPSKHEGFGLPALEAMACGTPTIGSNTTSIPEVIDCEDALFDPESPEDISQKIQFALLNESWRIQMKKHSIKQAKKFSWDTSAQKAIRALESMCNTRCRVGNIGHGLSLIDLYQSIADIYHNKIPTDKELMSIASSLTFNTNEDVFKQLLIDVSVIVNIDAKSGIQRVVRSTLLEILKKPPEGFHVCPIYFDGKKYCYATKFIAEFLGEPNSEAIDEVVAFKQDDIYLALDLNAHLTNLLHTFHKYLQCIGVKMYYVVYDILWVYRPDWWHDDVSKVFVPWLMGIAETSTGLICISEAVANEVRTWLVENPPKRLSLPDVMSFHLGADVENSMPNKGLPDDAQTTLDAVISIPSFLMVGTVEPRKGHAQTLAAFELLWTQGINVNLVIVGKVGWLVDKLVDKLRLHPELNQHLFWLEGISDEYLEKVYAASTCLIAPSEGEGFGLPLIEAAQHKKPIIARDIPVFREVAGQHAYYFNGLDPESLAVCVKDWLTLYAERKAPQSDNMPWLTWQESTHQLLSKILPE